MNFRFTVVETALSRAEFRWKCRRLIRYSLILGSVLCLLGLLLGVVILEGWITRKGVALFIFGACGVAGLLSWVLVAVSVFRRSPDRCRLGADMERVNRRLLDRLNTLLFLERRSMDSRTTAFARRIARQTQWVIAERPLAMPFGAASPARWLAGLLMLVLANLLFYQLYAPLRLLVASPTPPSQPARRTPAVVSQLELPATNKVERSEQWAEVRITQPGQDLKATRLASVPLQIEAAANQPLKEVSWYSAINGGEAVLHRLAPPSEPRYAVYQPTLDLADLPLTNWDIVSYYAGATAGTSNSYFSQVYFIEVRPFREELMGLPGGETGKAYEFLKALSGLISSQEQVARETHALRTSPAEAQQDEQRQKLAGIEQELSGAARSLYAETRTRPEAAVAAESLASLGKAERSLQQSAKLLEQSAVEQAEQRELAALAELTAARREFQKAVDENREAFEQADTDGNKPGSSNQLEHIAEFRNESGAAREFVKRALEQQKSLSQATQSKPSSSYPELAPLEQGLAQALKDFQHQHPEAFRPSQQESSETQQAMERAKELLQDGRPEAEPATRQATQKLDQLDQAMKERAADRQLADAYRLRQMLQQQMQTFSECANPANSDPGSGSRLRQTAGESRETVNQLRKLVEDEPTRDAFGAPLRQALGGQTKVELDATLNRLQQPLDEAAQKQGAAAARDGLSQIDQAFAQSEPRSLRRARQGDGLRPSPDGQISQGMADLNSLIKQLEKGNRPSSPERSRQGREALQNLQDGFRNRGESNQRGRQIQAQLQQMLKAEDLDVGDLKKLMESLQMFSIEQFESSKSEEKPEITNIDPSRMPPAYRGRIQKYFQKLSEQPK